MSSNWNFKIAYGITQIKIREWQMKCVYIYIYIYIINKYIELKLYKLAK